MAKIKLEFLNNEANETEGLNHPGIETYTDLPYASTARECGQNSSDAGSDRPVIIKFDKLTIPWTDIEEHQKLRSTIYQCLKQSKKDNNQKAIDYFENAKSLVDKDSVTTLCISDYNTHGLEGPCVPGRPFHSLVKSSGVSTKFSDTSGGSFGIGKYAVFALSDLRTIFYSTRYKDEDGNNQFLMQGKSILMSHTDEDGNYRHSTGYWGASNYLPMESEADVPTWLGRDKQGTTLVALGFREKTGWQYRMAASLVRNFFVAIHNGDLVFRLDSDAIIINAKTLPTLFEDEQLRKAAKNSNQLDNFEYSHYLYQCLTSEEAKKITLDIDGLGKVSLRILLRDDLPKRLSIIRNGMIITDSLEHFGHSFKRFSMYRDFVAMVEPLENQGSALIKRLENPRHDGLSPERVTDETKRAAAIKSMQKLGREIRNAIKEEALSKPQKIEPLDELAEFFADPGKSEPVQDPNADDDPENYVYTEVVRAPRKPSPPKIRGLQDNGGSGGGSGGGGNNGGGKGNGQGSGAGGTGKKSYESVPLEGTRNMITPGAARNQRSVWFTPQVSGTIKLQVRASGISSSPEIKITQVSQGIIEKGLAVVDATSGNRQQIELFFAENYAGPIEIIGLRDMGGAENADN